MTTEQRLVLEELNTLLRDHENAIKYFADLALRRIADIPSGIVTKLGAAAAHVAEAKRDYLLVLKQGEAQGGAA
jgi:hypothetical protein